MGLGCISVCVCVCIQHTVNAQYFTLYCVSGVRFFFADSKGDYGSSESLCTEQGLAGADRSGVTLSFALLVVTPLTSEFEQICLICVHRCQ